MRTRTTLPALGKLAALAAAALVLVACGGGGGDGGATAPGNSGEALTLGFSQVGAESGWRTANTKSIQECRGGRRHRAEVLRRPAEAGEPDQGDPLLHPAEGRRDRLLAGGRVRLGHRAQGGQGRRHPGDPHRPRGRLAGQVALQDVHRLGLRGGGQEGRRVAGQGVRGHDRAGQHRRAAGHHRLGAGQRPQEGLRRRDRGRPEAQGHRVADRRLHPGRRQGRSWRRSSRPTRRSTCCSRTTTTWASARSRRSRRPARCRARTSRSSRSTRSRTACRRWPTARSTSSSSAARCSARS